MQKYRDRHWASVTEREQSGERHWGRLSAQQVSSPRHWALCVLSSISMHHISPVRSPPYSSLLSACTTSPAWAERLHGVSRGVSRRMRSQGRALKCRGQFSFVPAHKWHILTLNGTFYELKRSDDPSGFEGESMSWCIMWGMKSERCNQHDLILAFTP